MYFIKCNVYSATRVVCVLKSSFRIRLWQNFSYLTFFFYWFSISRISFSFISN